MSTQKISFQQTKIANDKSILKQPVSSTKWSVIPRLYSSRLIQFGNNSKILTSSMMSYVMSMNYYKVLRNFSVLFHLLSSLSIRLITSISFSTQNDWSICVETHKGDKLLEKVPSFAWASDWGYWSNVLRTEESVKSKHFFDILHDVETGHNR